MIFLSAAGSTVQCLPRAECLFHEDQVTMAPGTSARAKESPYYCGVGQAVAKPRCWAESSSPIRSNRDPPVFGFWEEMRGMVLAGLLIGEGR